MSPTENLLKDVRRVQRRLTLQRFLAVLGWCLFWPLLSAVFLEFAAHFCPLDFSEASWFAGLLAAGLISAIGCTLIAVTSTLEAALLIDHRFGLKERISSALAMNALDRDTPSGQALLADAEARLRRVAVVDNFAVRFPRTLILPLFPATLLWGVSIYLPPMKRAFSEASETSLATKVRSHNATNRLRSKLIERHLESANRGLEDAADFLHRVDEAIREILKEPQREMAFVRLNDLAREVQEQRKQLGGDESLKLELEKIANIPHGPADELAQSLSKGDFQKAADGFKQIQEQFAAGALNSIEKNKLSEQIDGLKQRIQNLAQESARKKADFQKQLTELKFSERSDTAAKKVAEKLDRELQRAQQGGLQLDALQNLANKVGQGCQQDKQGQNVRSAETMQEAWQQIEKLAVRQSEIETLDAAMEQLSSARRQMNCDQCGGKGCEKCRGQSTAADAQHGHPGNAIGKEPGNASSPELPIDASYFGARVRQPVGNGASRVQGLAGGANLKNQAEAEIQRDVSAIQDGSTDPLSGQRLPKKQAEHVREYFDSFRNGK